MEALSYMDALPGRMATEIDEWLSKLPALGPERAADVSIVKGLARAVDNDFTNAALWRRLQAAVEVITLACDTTGIDPTAAALSSLA